ncbi:MAG: hypothetical protein LH609_11005 [Rudanella sp.]|nr:hypothetical protein [Rudanella sp.]
MLGIWPEQVGAEKLSAVERRQQKWRCPQRAAGKHVGLHGPMSQDSTKEIYPPVDQAE